MPAVYFTQENINIRQAKESGVSADLAASTASKNQANHGRSA